MINVCLNECTQFNMYDSWGDGMEILALTRQMVFY